MTKLPYKARNGATQWMPALSEKQYLSMEDSYEGFCLACGHTQDSCEPDAEKYTCSTCGASKVYGIPQLLMMGLCRIK